MLFPSAAGIGVLVCQGDLDFDGTASGWTELWDVSRERGISTQGWHSPASSHQRRGDELTGARTEESFVSQTPLRQITRDVFTADVFPCFEMTGQRPRRLEPRISPPPCPNGWPTGLCRALAAVNPWLAWLEWSAVWNGASSRVNTCGRANLVGPPRPC